jgi:hypothetical protein
MKYAEIVPPEEIDFEDGVAYISSDDAKQYGPLRSIRRPAKNGTSDWCELITLVHANGDVERVDGHLLKTGEME